MSGRVCPRAACGRVCTASALFCADCGAALVTREAIQEGLAEIRAQTRHLRQAQRVERQAREALAEAAREVRLALDGSL